MQKTKFALCAKRKNKMKRFLNPFMVLSLAMMLIMSSCASKKKIVYLQDMEETSFVQLESMFEALVSPSDELSILVSCADPRLAEPFNLSHEGTYLVDVNGNINFPSLGKIKVSGKTRLELQDYLANRLVEGGFLSDPIVTVRFENFKIFFLGSEGGKSITITNERCTLFEALALAGDLSAITRRDRIGILREENGKMTLHYVDPRSKDVFNNPYFMLRQNDFIITEARGFNYWMSDFSYYSSWLAGLTAVTSILTVILLLRK